MVCVNNWLAIIGPCFDQVFRMDMKMDQTIIMLNAIVKRLEEKDEQPPGLTDAQMNHEEGVPWQQSIAFHL